MTRLHPSLRAVGGVLVGALVIWGVGFLVQCGQPEPTRIVADAPGDLTQAVVHYDPRAHAAVSVTYTAMFAALPRDARVHVVVEERAHYDAFLAAFPSHVSFSPVIVDHPVTTWSRDRYTLLTRPDGTRILLVPPQSPQVVPARANDWLAPWKLAEADATLEVVQTPFDFDGGDLIAGADVVFADANLIRKNPDLFPNAAAVAQTLTALLGMPVVVLGASPDDVPPHHIGMYLTPLPNGAVAIGSPRLAMDLLGVPGREVLAADLDSDGLPAIDDRPETLHRFDEPARQLETLGYRVVRLPLVPLDDNVTFITFNNGVFHGSQFMVPSYETALDAEARRLLEAEGLTLSPIPVRRIFRHHGSVRCLINRL